MLTSAWLLAQILRLPETRGLSLEEIDELYTAKVKPWKSGSWVPPTRMQEGITDGDKVDEKGNVIHREHRKRKGELSKESLK